MTFGNNGLRVPSALRMAFVALAICIFPLGLFQKPAQAQDFEAVERRLGGAVEAGEISLEQALVMMKALWRSSEEAENEREHEFMEAERELEAAVRAGKMSREEAENHLHEIKEELFGEDDDHDHGEHEHDHGDHEHGDHDHEHGDHDHDHEHGDHDDGHDHEHGDHDDHDDHDDEDDHDHDDHDHEHGDHDREGGDREMAAKKKRYMEAAKRIKTMVKEGKSSEEDAETRLLQMRESMFGGDEAKRGGKDRPSDNVEAEKRRFMKMAEEVETAVKNGEMSPTDARRRLTRIRSAIAKIEDSKKDSAAKEKKNLEMAAKKKRYMEAARRIKAAVENGRASEEDGEKRLLELRKAMFGDDRD